MISTLRRLRWLRRPVGVFLDGLNTSGIPRRGKRVIRLACGHQLSLPMLHVPHLWSVMLKVLEELKYAETTLLFLHQPVFFRDLEEQHVSIEAQHELLFNKAREFAGNPMAIHPDNLTEDDYEIVLAAQRILSKDSVFSDEYLNVVASTRELRRWRNEKSEEKQFGRRCIYCTLLHAPATFFS